MHRSDNLTFLYEYQTQAKSAKEEDAALNEIISKLNVDKGEAGKRYQAYLKMLTDARDVDEHAERAPQELVSKILTQLLQEMVGDALSYYGLNFDELKQQGAINLCVAGSLARGEATAFSDIDCFMLINDNVKPETRRQIQKAMHAVCRVTDLLFMQKSQFCMDPMGLSLRRLTDTPADIAQTIENNNRDDLKIAMMGAVSVMGNAQSTKQLNDLKMKLKEKMPGFVPEFFYQLALDEFIGPKMDDTSYSVKKDFIRPVDFIFQGLLMQANHSPHDFKDVKEALDKLVKEKIISSGIAKLIAHLKEGGVNVRKFLHFTHGKEHEEVDRNAYLEKRVALIALLRGSVADWLHHSGKGERGVLELSRGNYLTCGNSIEAPIPELAKVHILQGLIDQLEHGLGRKSGKLHQLFNRLSEDEKNIMKDLISDLHKLSRKEFLGILDEGRADTKNKRNIGINDELSLLREKLSEKRGRIPGKCAILDGALKKIDEAVSSMKVVDDKEYGAHKVGRRE